MKFYLNEKKSIFSIDFENVVNMSPNERKEYFDSLIKKILNQASSEDAVKLNLDGNIYELNSEDVSIFMQCYEEYKKALEEIKQLELHTPSCRIDWIKIKDYSLEEKLKYFLNLMETIEDAPIVKPYTFKENGAVYIINEKDRSTYKVLEKEIKKCFSKLFRREALKEIRILFADYKELVRGSANLYKSFVKDKLEAIDKKRKISKKKGRILGGRVKLSSLKRGAALACSLGFVGNLALETISEGVQINRQALLEAATTSIEIQSENIEEESTVAVMSDIVEVQEVDTEALVEACSLSEEVIEEEVKEVFEDKAISSILVHYNSLDNTFSLEAASFEAKQSEEETSEPVKVEVKETSREEKRQALIDSYLEEYSIYFNMDVDKVIEIARSLTDNYQNDFSTILGEDMEGLLDEEAACMAFVYQLRRDKLTVSLDEIGTSKKDLLVSDEVYMQGRSEEETLILRTGETENQFMVRICDLLGIDEVYSLAISLYESGRFQSPMCRNKNNYGGLRSTKDYMVFPSPEAGIIAFCINLKKYEKYNLKDLSTLSSIYVKGSRKAEPSEVWVYNVKSFHSQIEENYEEFTGYPAKDADKTITLY